MPDQGPTVFKDRYELHRKLARGGMSDVYLARDQVLDRPVAVKVMFPEYAKDPTFVERFRREAQAAAKLNHPNVVAVYDWGEELGTYFIAMEYVEGRSLSEIIRAEGPLPPRRVAEITADIAAALGFAHQNGVVHRDVKPGNVIIETSGQVKVADFGIAQALTGREQAQLTRAGAVMGTATYFSPEQAQGKQVDQRSDLYSLGCVMFEMLATRPPFQGETPVAIAYKHVQEQPPTMASLGAHVPPSLDAIVMKSLQKEPSQRYQSADELRADLRRYLEGLPVTAAIAAVVAPPMANATMAVPATRAVAPASRTMPPPEEYYPPRRGSGIFIGLLVLMLIGLAVALVYIGSNLSSKSSLKKVAVPTVLNLPADQASLMLTNSGFKVDRQDIPNDKYEAGRVYDQSPKGQTEADEGSTVTISVAVAVGDTDVPGVVGASQTDAERQLRDQGFNPVVQQEASDTVFKGMVISQNPSAGTKKPKGSDIIIVVSTGKAAIEIPSVEGQVPSRAVTLLNQAGFKQTTQTTEFSNDMARGLVIRTDPGAGSKADPSSTTVVIVVSGGPEAPTTTAPPPTTTPPTTKPAPTTTKAPATTTTTKVVTPTSVVPNND